jgi:hypothetical protein
MKQLSFANAEFAAKKEENSPRAVSRGDEAVVPWSRLLEALQPFDYPRQPWASRSSADRLGADAADVRRAAMVCLGR